MPAPRYFPEPDSDDDVFQWINADDPVAMRPSVTPGGVAPPSHYSSALCPVCGKNFTPLVQTGKSDNPACSLQCAAILETREDDQDPVLQVDKLEDRCYYLHHKAPPRPDPVPSIPGLIPVTNPATTVVVPPSVSDELDVMRTAVQKLSAVESSDGDSNLSSSPAGPPSLHTQSVPLRLQKVPVRASRQQPPPPSGRVRRFQPTAAPPPPQISPNGRLVQQSHWGPPPPPQVTGRIQKTGSRLPQQQQGHSYQPQPPYQLPVPFAETDRERYERVARMTLTAIENGSYTYKAKNINLLPHIKQSKDGTRFYGEESTLAGWNGATTVAGSRLSLPSSLAPSTVSLSTRDKRVSGESVFVRDASVGSSGGNSKRTGTLVVIMKVSTVDAAKILKEMCKAGAPPTPSTSATSAVISQVPPRYDHYAQHFLPQPPQPAVYSNSPTPGSSSPSAASSLKIGILNFASPKAPGGTFKEGGTSQEASIVRVSTLYPALSETREGSKFYAAIVSGSGSGNGGGTTKAKTSSTLTHMSRSATMMTATSATTTTSVSIDGKNRRASSTRSDVYTLVERVSEHGHIARQLPLPPPPPPEKDDDILTECFYTNSILYTPSVLVIFNDKGEAVNPLKVQVVSCSAVDAARALGEWEVRMIREQQKQREKRAREEEEERKRRELEKERKEEERRRREIEQEREREERRRREMKEEREEEERRRRAMEEKRRESLRKRERMMETMQQATAIRLEKERQEKELEAQAGAGKLEHKGEWMRERASPVRALQLEDKRACNYDTMLAEVEQYAAANAAAAAAAVEAVLSPPSSPPPPTLSTDVASLSAGTGKPMALDSAVNGTKEGQRVSEEEDTIHIEHGPQFQGQSEKRGYHYEAMLAEVEEYAAANAAAAAAAVDVALTPAPASPPPPSPPATSKSPGEAIVRLKRMSTIVSSGKMKERRAAEEEEDMVRIGQGPLREEQVPHVQQKRVYDYAPTLTEEFVVVAATAAADDALSSALPSPLSQPPPAASAASKRAARLSEIRSVMRTPSRKMEEGRIRTGHGSLQEVQVPHVQEKRVYDYEPTLTEEFVVVAASSKSGSDDLVSTTRSERLRLTPARSTQDHTMDRRVERSNTEAAHKTMVGKRERQAEDAGPAERARPERDDCDAQRQRPRRSHEIRRKPVKMVPDEQDEVRYPVEMRTEAVPTWVMAHSTNRRAASERHEFAPVSSPNAQTSTMERKDNRKERERGIEREHEMDRSRWHEPPRHYRGEEYEPERQHRQHSLYSDISRKPEEDEIEDPITIQVVYEPTAVDSQPDAMQVEAHSRAESPYAASEISGSSRVPSVPGLDLDLPSVPAHAPSSNSSSLSVDKVKPAERKPGKDLITLEDVEKQIYEQMHERMARILFVFERKGVRNIVLGAFGTGVQKNNVKDVARIWALLLAGRFRTSFDRVVFAIIAAESVVGEFQGAFEGAVCGGDGLMVMKGLSSDGKPLCVVCKKREAYAGFVTCGLKCNERLCREGGDLTMCDYCHRRPRQRKKRQCGKLCTEKARDACLLCKMRPRKPGKDLCGESCRRIAAKNTPLVLEAPKWHSVFAKVEEHFKSSWKASTKPIPEVKKVFQIIEDDALLTPYDAYLKRVGNEGFRYHGTKRQCKIGVSATELCSSATCPICNILRTSFKVSTADPTSAFGPGIYTSSASNKACSYCDKADPSLGALLLTKVVMGKSRYVSAWKEVVACPPGFDSVVFDRHKGNLNETIVYTDNAIRPIFLIMF